MAEEAGEDVTGLAGGSGGSGGSGDRAAGRLEGAAGLSVGGPRLTGAMAEKAGESGTPVAAPAASSQSGQIVGGPG